MTIDNINPYQRVLDKKSSSKYKIMLTVIVHLEAKNEKDTLSIIHDLGKGAAFFDHPKLAYLKQEMLFSGTEVKPRQREVVATEYFLEIETNPSLEKRIRQALSL